MGVRGRFPILFRVLYLWLQLDRGTEIDPCHSDDVMSYKNESILCQADSLSRYRTVNLAVIAIVSGLSLWFDLLLYTVMQGGMTSTKPQTFYMHRTLSI
jgi:hypothetical protein